MLDPSPTPRFHHILDRIRDSALLVDLGPVIALAVLTLANVRSPRGEPWATLVLVVLPLAVRRRWPLVTLAVIALGVVVTSSRGGWIDVGAAVLASFTLGYLATNRARSGLSVLLVAGAMSAFFLGQETDPALAIALPFVVFVPSWVLGDVVRGWRLEAAARREATERHVHEREARLQAEIAEQRRHVVRELHDVVAHGVSVMLIQAGAARQVVRTSPDRAEEALLAVEATGREAMGELRRLLGVLSDEGEAPGLVPQPGIDQLGALVERVRLAGLPAELQIHGPKRSVPSGLDVTVYRIVQEALTNALRYARRARTLVHLTYELAQIRVEVLDDGPASEEDAAEGSGRGLVGMRERASLVGGRLEAGPRLGGGYAVRAWLPMEPESS